MDVSIIPRSAYRQRRPRLRGQTARGQSEGRRARGPRAPVSRAQGEMPRCRKAGSEGRGKRGE
eukprot:scaffold14334_cov28-Tisochrysis_lutea.AAC.1